MPSATPRRRPIRSPTTSRRSSPAFGWMNSSATIPPIPTAYQLIRRRVDRRRPLTGSSYSAAPNCPASSRSITRRSVSPRPIRIRAVVSTPSGLVRAEHRQEGFLGYFDGADPLHASLALFLLLEQLPLAGDVATVALGKDVLAQGADRLARDHVRADGRLDRHLEHLSRDQLLQPAGECPADRDPLLAV